MKTFFVSIPITGTATVEVKAADSKAAVAKAWEVLDVQEPDVTWEYVEQIVEGNCFHGMQNTRG